MSIVPRLLIAAAMTALAACSSLQQAQSSIPRQA
jgi:hypothetical protein